MIRGSISEADWARLHEYTRTVSKFIVTDNGSNAQISPTVFIRIARLLRPDMPLLPYLSDLVIVDADLSINYLDLLLTPSLKSLNASCIPDAQQSTFSSFLTAIEQEVPPALLQTLILGPGLFLPSSLQTISQFHSLLHLELKHEGSKLPSAFFDNIGSLAMLKTFILDARYVSDTMTGDEPTVPPPFPSDIFPNYNTANGIRDEHGSADIRHSKTFNQLEILHVTGWLPLLEDLIHRVTSTKLEDVSVTFIRLSFDEWKVSLAKEKAEREKKAEDRRREEAEKKMKEQEKLLKDEMEQKRIDEISSPPPSFGHEFPCEPDAEPDAYGREQSVAATTLGGGKKKKKGRQSVQDSEVVKKQEEVREKLLKEQERLASLSFEAHTESFAKVLRKLCLTPSSPILKSLSVRQLGGSLQWLLNPPTFPEDLFRTMLLLPAIESLKVKGWLLDYVEGVLTAAEPIPNLKSLLLPLGRLNSGISLPTLRHVAKICPKLESLQCYINPLSPVPEYSIPTDVGLSHGLQILSVGSSFPLPVAKKLGYLIARHLYLLFPKLETIRTSEGQDAELWVIVDEFVKMFQTARMDDLNRQ